MQTGSGLQTERNFGAVDAVDAWISAWGGTAEADALTGEKAQFHQSPGDLVGEVEAIEDGLLSGIQFQQGGGLGHGEPVPLPETELHSDHSIRPKQSNFASGGAKNSLFDY